MLRGLVYAFAATLSLAFIVSIYGLPYARVREFVAGKPRVVIKVAASQWSWHLGQDSAPANVPVEFVVTSKDVKHGFALYNPTGRLVG